MPGLPEQLDDDDNAHQQRGASHMNTFDEAPIREEHTAQAGHEAAHQDCVVELGEVSGTQGGLSGNTFDAGFGLRWS